MVQNTPSGQSYPFPTKELTGPEMGELGYIIVKCFPTEQLLEVFLQTKLNIPYGEITEGSTYSVQVFYLIRNYLQPRNLIPDLLEAMAEERPRNISLREFRQKYLTYQENLGKDIILEMVAIPGGKFMMGSNERPDTKPIHEVTVSPFYMGKYPVTQKQWKAIAQLPKIEIDLDPNISSFKGDKKPVDSATWDMAMEFCKRLSKLTGKNYRLPSEAEWEYACRAGTTTKYHFGDNPNPSLANYGQNLGGTSSVGSFPPNSFGLYDMHGNVWEWCLDDWQREYNNRSLDGGAWFSDDDSHEGGKCLRGGSWSDGLGSSAIRALYGLYHRKNYTCPLNLIGFRVCSWDFRMLSFVELGDGV